MAGHYKSIPALTMLNSEARAGKKITNVEKTKNYLLLMMRLNWVGVMPR